MSDPWINEQGHVGPLLGAFVVVGSSPGRAHVGRNSFFFFFFLSPLVLSSAIKNATRGVWSPALGSQGLRTPCRGCRVAAAEWLCQPGSADFIPQGQTLFLSGLHEASAVCESADGTGSVAMTPCQRGGSPSSSSSPRRRGVRTPLSEWRVPGSSKRGGSWAGSHWVFHQWPG